MRLGVRLLLLERCESHRAGRWRAIEREGEGGVGGLLLAIYSFWELGGVASELASRWLALMCTGGEGVVL